MLPLFTAFFSSPKFKLKSNYRVKFGKVKIPLFHQFLFSNGLPDQFSVCIKNAFYYYVLLFHFFLFFIVCNTLSNSSKRTSQICLNWFSHLSISFILFTSSW